MAGFLDALRKEVVSAVFKDETQSSSLGGIDDKIALGVLLWVVAEADNKFLPQELEKIKEVLMAQSKISETDVSVVLQSVQEAARARIDLYQFTSEIKENLPYGIKVGILEELFRVACADHDLDDNEVEVIRKISSLFGVSHKDFIHAKIRVKKESGLDIAGL